MKKLLLSSFLFLSIYTNLKAQQYYPMLDSVNSWSYTQMQFLVDEPASLQYGCGNNINDGGTSRYYTTHDTVIHALNYKLLYKNTEVDSCLYGFLREDTSARKIYFQDINDSPEVLLYNFSMQIGDSMNVNFIDTEGYFFHSGFYMLDSIGTVAIHAGMRRAFYLNCKSCSNYDSSALVWIESVGNLGDVIYPYTLDEPGFDEFPTCQGFPHDFIKITTCFEHNQLVYYDSCAFEYAMQHTIGFIYKDTCDYANTGGAVIEVGSPLSFTVSPNPAREQLVIRAKSNTKEEAIVYIVNVLGQLASPLPSLTPAISKGEGERTIDVSNLAPGIYFVRVIDEAGAWTGKFVKE